MRTKTYDATGFMNALVDEIGDSDDVTVVLYHRLKVVQRWKFEKDKFDENEVKAIIEATEAELKKK